MSTDFTQHNPTEANQLSDSAFASNSLTTGGIGTDAIMPSNWMNARWYEDSTFIAAFAQALSNKGYAVSKDNISTLASVLGNVITNADLKPNLLQVAYSPTPTFDASKANGFRIILSGNVTSSTLINTSPFQVITFSVENPNNAFTFAWPSSIRVASTAQSVFGNSDWNFQQTFVVLENGLLYPIDSEVIHLFTSKQDTLGFTPVQQGGGASQLSDKVYIGWDGTGLRAQIDSTDLGRFLFASGLPLASLTGNGYIKIPLASGSNLIVQWATGTVDTNSGTVFQTIALPIAFPNACLAAFASTNWIGSNDDDLMSYQISAISTTQVGVRRSRRGDDGTYTSSPTIIAIGY